MNNPPWMIAYKNHWSHEDLSAHLSETDRIWSSCKNEIRLNFLAIFLPNFSFKQ